MKIFVSGYWNQNLGDDLFLHLLCQRYPQCQFEIICGHQAFTSLADLTNLTRLTVPFRVKLAHRVATYFSHGPSQQLDQFQIKEAALADAYVELGGSLFKLPAKGMGHQFKLRQEILALNRPYFVIGSNFGPYSQPDQVRRYADLFQQMRHVSFRDHFSADLFADLPNVSWAPDLAFNLDVSHYRKGQRFTLISVINPTNRFDPQSCTEYFQLVINLVKKEVESGNRVVLMAFCQNEGDLTAAQKIQAEVKSNQVSIYVHHDVNDSLAMIAQAKRVVATRFHAMILAWLFAKPTFVISYSHKINQVIADVFPDQSLVDISHLNRVAADQVNFNCPPSLQAVVKRAGDQFAALDHFLQVRGAK